MNILLIDNSIGNYSLLNEELKNDIVDFANLYEIASVKISSSPYDLIILNFDLLKEKQMDFSESLKLSIKNKYTPFVLLVCPMAGDFKELVKKTGAVDYILNPIDGAEIKTKISGQLTNKKNLFTKKVEDCNRIVTMNFMQHEISCTGTDSDMKYKLTPTEFKLFYFLYKNANEVISRDLIYKEVWKNKTDKNQRIVDKHLTTLRKKICQKVFKIESVHGAGYRMTIKESACGNPTGEELNFPLLNKLSS